MKTTYLKIALYSLGILIALYVTGLRITAFLFEYGTQTPETDTIKHLFYFTIPDFISVVFSLLFVVYFIKKIKILLK